MRLFKIFGTVMIGVGLASWASATEIALHMSDGTRHVFPAGSVKNITVEAGDPELHPRELRVGPESGKDAGGYEWNQLHFRLAGNMLTYSFQMKIWKTTDNSPITQMFLVANENVALCAFYNAIPGYEDPAGFRAYSGEVQLPDGIQAPEDIRIQFFKGLHYTVEQAIQDQVQQGTDGRRTIAYILQ